MTTKVESRQIGPTVDYLIALFTQATQPREIELLADHLGDLGDPRAIRPLIMRLGDCQVQEDPDVEDAVCRALIALGVMRSSGNLSFSLRPRNTLTDDVAETIRQLAGMIPWRYYGTAWI
jgi:hypothetical protein